MEGRKDKKESDTFVSAAVMPILFFFVIVPFSLTVSNIIMAERFTALLARFLLVISRFFFLPFRMAFILISLAECLYVLLCIRRSFFFLIWSSNDEFFFFLEPLLELLLSCLY